MNIKAIKERGITVWQHDARTHIHQIFSAMPITFPPLYYVKLGYQYYAISNQNCNSATDLLHTIYDRCVVNTLHRSKLFKVRGRYIINLLTVSSYNATLKDKSILVLYKTRHVAQLIQLDDKHDKFDIQTWWWCIRFSISHKLLHGSS